MDFQIDLESLKQQGIYHEKIIGIFVYGSVVYGTNGKISDVDLILVDNRPILPEQNVKRDYDCSIYSKDAFIEMLDSNEISALECMYLPKQFSVLNNLDYTPTINLSKLRSAISHKASNSFVKCRKKLEVEGDFYIGKKSLWHSLRILKFGIQLAKHNKIVDYSEANDLWYDIIQSPEEEWSYYKETYQPLYNSLCTEFRKLAPK